MVYKKINEENESDSGDVALTTKDLCFLISLLTDDRILID